MTNDDNPSRPNDNADSDSDSEQRGVFGYDDADKREVGKKKGFFRRHPVMLGFVALLAIIVAGVGGFLAYLNHTIGSIDTFDATSNLDESDRPVKVDNDSLNILMAGVDKGNGGSVGDFIDAGWRPGVFRSDTIMILHITADRDHAYLVSIPRDSYVKLYDESGNFEEMNKVNAALSIFGPSAYISTIEHLTDLRMDHIAIVDWQGFKDISTALGGVEIYIPETFTDTSQNRTWYEGTQSISGEDALAYVRTRYGLANGDFDRMARQQNFLRAMMGKMLSKGTLVNPFKLTNTLKAVVKYLTVDNDFSTGEIRNLAISLRGIHTDDVTFLTAPWSGYGNEIGSTVHLDQAQCNALWKAMAEDDIAGYINQYGSSSGVLPGNHNVN